MSETDPSSINAVPIETSQTTPPLAPPPDSANDKSFPYKMILFGIFALLLIVGAIFAVMSFAQKKTSGPVQLTYWGLWEDAATIQPLITKFEQKNPNIKIVYQKLTAKQYRQKVIVRGKDNRGPDIFTYHNTWVPMMAEILTPVPKEYYTPDSFKKTFYPVIAQDLIIDDSILGIPLSIDGLVLLYNKDMFKRAGLVNAPYTWEDVITYANELTVPDQSGGIITAGIALGTANNIDHFSDIFGWMLLQNGASISDLSSPEAQEVLESYRQFAESPDNVWDDRMPNNVLAFAQGKVAMIMVPTWQILTVKALNPETQVGVAPLPVLPGEEEPLSVASYWVEGVSRQSQHQKEAFMFLSFLGEKENLIERFSLQSKTRLFGSAYPRIDMKEMLKDNEYLVPLIAQASFMKSIPTMSKTFDEGLNDEINTYLKSAIDDAGKGVSYQEAMRTADAGIGQVLEKFKIKTTDSQ